MVKNSPKLILVTNRKVAKIPYLDVISAAAAGGVDSIILREKDLSPIDLYTLAQQVKDVIAKHNVSLIINTSLEVALAVNAEGVHCTGASLSPDTIKPFLNRGMLLGASIHSVDEAIHFCKVVDYLLVGHVFATSSKLGLPPKGLDLIKKVSAVSVKPVVAIGGIDASNLQTVLDHGAHGIAVMSAIMSASDPHYATVQLKNAIKKRSCY